MKFSVICPVYNAEEYLHPCIESVLKQTHEDLDLLLIDDGSTDSSGVICDAYAEQLPGKIKVFHTKNQGALLAREYGIKKATGEVVLFLDADDCLREDMMKILNQAFTQSECDLILFDASMEESYCKSFRHFPFVDGQIFEGASKQELYQLLLTTSMLNNVCLKAAKKEVLNDSVDYTRYGFVKHGEDLLRSVSLLNNANRVLYIADNLYFYRQHSLSVVHRFHVERQKSIKAVHQELEKYIDIWEMQAYRGKHYAREVRGWIETLGLLMNNRETMERKAVQEYLCQLASDEYFRNAYVKMERAELSYSQRLSAGLLYRKKYGVLRLVFCVRKTMGKARRFFVRILEGKCSAAE